MRRRQIVMGGAVWIASLALHRVAAPAGQASSREDRIRSAVQRIDRAATELGEQSSYDRLAEHFKVSVRVVTDLHEQKLDSGEVAAVLALAEAGKSSPDTILGWWASGRLSWSQIADRLRVGVPELEKRLTAVGQALRRRGR